MDLRRRNRSLCMTFVEFCHQYHVGFIQDQRLHVLSSFPHLFASGRIRRPLTSPSKLWGGHCPLAGTAARLPGAPQSCAVLFARSVSHVEEGNVSRGWRNVNGARWSCRPRVSGVLRSSGRSVARTANVSTRGQWGSRLPCSRRRPQDLTEKSSFTANDRIGE